MERTIGIDVHSASCTVAVVNSNGHKLQVTVVETNGEALIGAVRAVPGTRRVILEEGTQAGWLSELLEPHAAEVVVAHLGEVQRGQKNDKRDAFALAERLRLGDVQRRVFKKESRFRELRQLARAYRMLTGDTTRIKNRLKSLFRARGISCSGVSVYAPEHRDEWLEKLETANRLAAEPLWEQLDAVQDIRSRTERKMIAASHRHPISRCLETVPGFGPIRVAQLLPIVVTPHRFRTRQQFWSYCGLGIVMRSSSDWVQTGDGWKRGQVARTAGLSKQANLTLKCLFKGAAQTVIQALHDDPLYRHYVRLLDAGTKPDLARLTIARRVAAITLSLWKNEEVYDPKRIAIKAPG